MAVAEAPQEHKTVAKDEAPALYQFSTWLHVGAGAEACEDAENGECADRSHFHAWIRLPNQFQHKEIRDKALGAKARKTRQMRDPDSDAFAILEEEIEALARQGDMVRPSVVETLLAKDWWRDFLKAGTELRLETGDEDEAPWATVDADEERFAELAAQNEEDRPKDEWAELEKRLAAWNTAVDERHKEMTKPRREALESKDVSALLDLLRDARVDTETNDAFMATYSEWEWLICTYVQPHGKRRFDSKEQMVDSPGEVIDALRVGFQDLERTAQEVASGNS